MVNIPSPAIAIVGRHNSGKTTLIEKLIAELVSRGLDVGSIKHHSHKGFEIDVPGKDSYRHRHAGASETVISCPGQVARVKTVEGELECPSIVESMPGHDIVLVEGYRKSGLFTIELMRAGNDADVKTAEVLAKGAEEGWQLGVDFTQAGRAGKAIKSKLPGASTVCIVTDIEIAHEAAKEYGIPAYGINDIAGIATYIEQHHARKHLSVVIQAGGESRRMGQSKATVPFCGKPLISRIVSRMLPVADELIITTNEPENLDFLKHEFPEANIKLVRDISNVRGALHGLHTAFRAAQTPFVATIACDMVFASPAVIAAEAYELARKQADAVVPYNKHGFEPFHAVYRRNACLSAVEAALSAGQVRAQDFFSKINVSHFSQAQVLKAEPRGKCFMNANTPGELKAFEKMVAAEKDQQ